MSNVGQLEFSEAILDPTSDVPMGLSNPDGRPAQKRFDVYRNNVILSLLDAMATGFPVVKKLLGDEFFRAMTLEFVRANPPSSPLMMHFGTALPNFLEGFEPAQKLGFLPDIARIEIAMRESYHAADAEPVSGDLLQTTPPDQLMEMQFKLAPSVRMLRSRWPIYSIWLANQEPAGPTPEPGGQAVLITRPEFDPWPNLLPAGAATLVMAIENGATFGNAIEQTTEKVPHFDLSQTLALLLQAQALCPFKKETP